MDKKMDTGGMVINILAEMLSTESNNINTNLSFHQLGINSIQFISLVVQCENMLDIIYEEEMLLVDAFPSVDAFIDYIKDRDER